MGAHGQSIATLGDFSAMYAQGLLKDLRPEQAARKPHFATPGAGTVVDTNHPVFLFGHLSLYPTRVWAVAGLGEGKHEAPAGWNELFAAGVECKDDAAGTIYPSLAAVTERFFASHAAACAAVREMDDALLARENPNERSRARFPTIGALFTFVLSAHVMVHMGQISAWRRCFGLPSAMG